MIAQGRKRIDNHSPEEAKKRVDEQGVASDESNFTTGTEIRIDGGWIAG